MSLREKLLKSEEESRRDWETRKIRWQNAVGKLYVDVMNWLAELERDGLVRFVQVENEASEELLGSYKINQLEMDFKKTKVILQPVGAMVVGADGRVDMFRRGFHDQAVMLIYTTGNDEGEGGWDIWSGTSPRDARPLTKENLETILEAWLS